MMQTDTLTCIDRYEHSPTHGEQVLPFVALWNRPGNVTQPAQQMTGALAHGTEVKVLEKIQYKRETWCKVEAEQGGRMRRGWCKGLLLENYGKGTKQDG